MKDPKGVGILEPNPLFSQFCDFDILLLDFRLLSV